MTRNTQAKALISRLDAYDDAISKMEVQAQSGQAQLDTANAKLNEMKLAARATTLTIMQPYRASAIRLLLSR